VEWVDGGEGVAGQVEWLVGVRQDTLTHPLLASTLTQTQRDTGTERHTHTHARTHLVAPHAGKDVVELDVDGAEGQEASHHHLGQRRPGVRVGRVACVCVCWLGVCRFLQGAVLVAHGVVLLPKRSAGFSRADEASL
jgi:hypothetical protein